MKWPERLELIAEMPLTPTRKIIKGALRPTARPADIDP
jgi:non-ribosomal peptide synthetase component E (peptide arylation enzyme)